MSALLPIKAQELGAESQYPKHIGGQYGHDQWGRVWVYFQASVALSQGEALEVASYAGATGTIDTAAAANTRRVADTGVFTTTALVGMFGLDGNHENGGHVYTWWANTGATQGQGGPIIKRVDDDQADVYFVNSDDGLIATALTTSTAFTVYTLSRLAKAVSATITGNVAYVQRQGGFTDEYWGWALTQGQGVAIIDTSEQVLAAGDKFRTSDSTDGTIEGGVSSSPANSFYGSGTAIMDQDADGLVPVVANCQVNIAPWWIPGNLRTAYPSGQL